MTLVGDVVRAQSRLESLYRSRGVLVSGENVHGIRHREAWQEQGRVVMQQDFATRTKNGKPCRNTCCTFRLEDGKIAEVFEHADTLHSKLTIQG